MDDTPPADGHEHEWGVWHRVTDDPDGWDHFTRQCLATVECPAMQKGRMVPDRPDVTDAMVEAACTAWSRTQRSHTLDQHLRAIIGAALEAARHETVTDKPDIDRKELMHALWDGALDRLEEEGHEISDEFMDWWHDVIETPVSIVLCHVYGHKPMLDHCGLPEHTYCVWCSKPMPGAAGGDDA